MGDTSNHSTSAADLTVLVSCPSLLADNQLRCTLDKGSTIEQLKSTISTHLDSRPNATEQRLIFRGRILADGETLERVFEKIDYIAVPPTVHLVVSQLHSRSSSFTHSAPASPSPLWLRNNTGHTQGRTSSTIMASSTPNAADTRASSAPPSSTPLGHASSATPSSQPSSTTTSSYNKTNEATAPPPPYTYTLPWTSPIHHTLYQPYQYAIVNGMPYLIPAGYMSILQQQQQQQQAILGYPMAYGSMMVMNADGSMTFVNAPMTHDQLHAAAAGSTGTAAPGAAPGAAGAGAGGMGEAVAAAAAAAAAAAPNPQDIAVQDQRRAASLWLLMKLAFGVYLFGQNGSFERKVLLHIAALIIFLHQTGRLRIVRRIAPVNPDDQGNVDVNRPQDGGGQARQDGAGEAGSSGARSVDTSSNSGSGSSSSSSTTASTGDHLNEKAGDEGSSSLSGSGSDGVAVQGGSSSSSTAAANSGADASQRQANTSAQDQQPVMAPQGRVSVWRNIEHALLTFVTSLVPAPAPEIDQAVANAAAAGERM